MKQLLKFGIVLTIAIVSSKLAFAFAYAERGYEAIGGEVLVFPLVLIVGAYLTGLIKLGFSIDDQDETEDDY